MEIPMRRSMNRRRFLARASASITALAATFSGWTVSAKQPDQTIYRLNPFWESTESDGHRCGGRRACAACVGLGARRLFVSLDAANTYRAHPGCDCHPVAGETAPYGTLVALFGSPQSTQRQFVDTRWSWVNGILN
jgi:hypothetical protein